MKQAGAAWFPFFACVAVVNFVDIFGKYGLALLLFFAIYGSFYMGTQWQQLHDRERSLSR